MFSFIPVRNAAKAHTFVLAVVLAALCGSGTIRAQVTASMTGTVKDSTGAIVPGATVTVKHTESGLTRMAETDANGNYTVPSLPVGQYEVDAEKAGFKVAVRKGITLVVGQQAVVNVTLEVGSVEEQITVSAEAPLVNTTLSSTSGLVGEKEVKDLPLNGRSFTQLLTLNVGTSNYTANSNNGNAFSVVGRRPEENRFLLNGVDFIGTDATGQVVMPIGASGQLLGVDAIREYNLIPSTYGAEYGKRAGGQVSIVTSSGTNSVHGDAFEFLRNSVLDARNFYDRFAGARLPAFKRNQFGGSLGGPIQRDKLFVFGNYEGFRQTLGLSSAVVVPDNNARQGLLPCNVITPAPNPCPASGVAPVPGLKQGMLPFLNNFWPAPNGDNRGGGLALSFNNPVQKIHENFLLTRADYNLSGKDTISGTYTFDDGESDSPGGNAGTGNPVFMTIAPTRGQLASMQETHVFAPSTLNVFTIGFNRANGTSHNIPSAAIPANLSFIAGTTPGTITVGGGAVASVAASVTTPNGNNGVHNIRNLYSLSDDLHYIHGKHSMSFGVWAQRNQQNLSGPIEATSGTVSYSTLQNLLSDNPTTFLAVPNVSPMGYYTTQAAWYVQDEIKFRPNLTVRIGLRDEMTTGWNERTGRGSNYLYQNGVIQTDPLIGRSTLTENNAIALWQPRAGIVWDPTGSGKWSIRAAAGIYNSLQDSLAHRLIVNPPFNTQIEIDNTPLLSFIPLSPAGAKAPDPSCNAQLIAAKAPCAIIQPGGIEPAMHTPTVQSWSLTVERELTRNMMVQVGYVGSQSYHLQISADLNSFTPQRCADAAGCVSGGTLGAVGRAPQGADYLPPVAANPLCPNGIQSRPNCYVTNPFSWFFEGTGAYHALNLSWTQRSSHGLNFKANYTFSKATDITSAITASAGTNEPQTVLNPFNLKLNKGVAAFSLHHQFNANFSYELPFGSGKTFGSGAHGVGEHIIGGWQWNGIITAQSGFPFTPVVGSNRSGTGDTRNPDTPNHNPNFSGSAILGKPTRWYDPNAFALPSAGTFGNVSRGSYIGPRLVDIDTSLFKNFKVMERWGLQFRAEAFNIFNHANFGSPSPIVFSGANFSTSAGVITKTATTSRQLQFALKLSF